ncbi:unnamed protein product [Closterium sp. NIES-53]
MQGHGNARILAALQQQAERCTLSSRAFHNDRFPLFARRITALMGYDKVLPMNTGAEAVETALKVARKWAYEKKGVPANQALVISCCGCFHGRTMAAISMSCDNDATRGFGPLLPGNLKVDFGDVDGLKRLLEEHGPRVAAFIVEPIQGEAGVVVPPEGYLRAVRQLCSQHGVLLLADEIQTGLARTGRMLACDHEGVRPDVLGHGNARILAALQQQAERCTLSSRAFHNDRFPLFARRITALMGYDKVLPMNTGAEAVETALKVARKWAYEKKGVPANQALVISCCGCFHGRTMAAISMSCDNDATRGFGPLLPGNLKVDFGDVDGLKRLLEEHGPRVAAFIVEPIQGEAGVVVPPEGYLRAVRQLCSQHGVLLLADEIQTGLARTGRMLACDHEGVRPDVLILGKALGGGVVPVSAVLADDDVMGCIRPGEHGSTFGGNPLASAVAMAALAEIEEGGLAHRAQRLGEQLQAQLKAVQARYPELIQEVRGRGLLVAVQVAGEGLPGGVTALDVCEAMKERGVLAKPTHNTIIRLAPPLTISEEELGRAAAALEAVLGEDMPRLVAQAAAAGADKKNHSKEPCDRCGRVR